MSEEVGPGGIYEHYKSTPEQRRLYGVIALSHLESTGEVMVHYHAMYNNGPINNSIYSDGITMWTRTLANFSGEIDKEGQTVPRFKRVS